jgi:hypothetical protein
MSPLGQSVPNGGARVMSPLPPIATKIADIKSAPRLDLAAFLRPNYLLVRSVIQAV